MSANINNINSLNALSAQTLQGDTAAMNQGSAYNKALGNLITGSASPVTGAASLGMGALAANQAQQQQQYANAYQHLQTLGGLQGQALGLQGGQLRNASSQLGLNLQDVQANQALTGQQQQFLNQTEIPTYQQQYANQLQNAQQQQQLASQQYGYNQMNTQRQGAAEGQLGTVGYGQGVQQGAYQNQIQQQAMTNNIKNMQLGNTQQMGQFGLQNAQYNTQLGQLGRQAQGIGLSQNTNALQQQGIGVQQQEVGANTAYQGNVLGMQLYGQLGNDIGQGANMNLQGAQGLTNAFNTYGFLGFGQPNAGAPGIRTDQSGGSSGSNLSGGMMHGGYQAGNYSG